MATQELGTVLIFCMALFIVACALGMAVFYLGFKMGQASAIVQLAQRPVEKSPSQPSSRRQIMREQLGLNIPIFAPRGYQPIGAKERQQEVNADGEGDDYTDFDR